MQVGLVWWVWWVYLEIQVRLQNTQYLKCLINHLSWLIFTLGPNVFDETSLFENTNHVTWDFHTLPFPGNIKKSYYAIILWDILLWNIFCRISVVDFMYCLMTDDERNGINNSLPSVYRRSVQKTVSHDISKDFSWSLHTHIKY